MEKATTAPVDIEQSDLFVTDAEMIRKLNVPEKIGRAAIQELDKIRAGRHRFPEKDPLMGNRRFWPAVVNYFRLRHGLGGVPMAAPLWQEDHGNASKTGEAGRHRDQGSDLESQQDVLDRLLDAAGGHCQKRVSRKKLEVVAAVGEPDNAAGKK